LLQSVRLLATSNITPWAQPRGRLCGLVVTVRFLVLPDPLSLMRITEEILEKKINGCGLENRD
jgi:hypothetical protein